MSGLILAIRSRTAGTSASTSRCWRRCGRRRQTVLLKRDGLQNSHATTMKSGPMKRSGSVRPQVSINARRVRCRPAFRSRIIR